MYFISEGLPINSIGLPLPMSIPKTPFFLSTPFSKNFTLLMFDRGTENVLSFLKTNPVLL